MNSPAELRFACPHCGQRIACDPAYAGRPMICPTCQQALQIPLPDPASATANAPAEAAQTEPFTVPALTNEAPTEWGGDESAPDDAVTQPEGFFKLDHQLRYAAVYAVIVFYVGLLVGWEPARQLATPDNAGTVKRVGETSVRNEINYAMWLLITASVCSGYGMVKGGYFLPLSRPRRRGWLGLIAWVLDSDEPPHPRIQFIRQWAAWAMLIYAALGVFCLVAPSWLASTLVAFARG